METKEALTVHVTKEFPVTVDELYRAWITPDALKHWWHPMGNDLKDVTLNVNEGGDFRYVFQSKEGEPVFAITGRYEDVKEAERLAYTWNWELPEKTIQDSQFKLIISFSSGANNGSRLDVTQENFKSDESVLPHHEGWEKALNDLHSYLSSKSKKP